MNKWILCIKWAMIFMLSLCLISCSTLNVFKSDPDQRDLIVKSSKDANGGSAYYIGVDTHDTFSHYMEANPKSIYDAITSEKMVSYQFEPGKTKTINFKVEGQGKYIGLYVLSNVNSAPNAHHQWSYLVPIKQKTIHVTVNQDKILVQQ